MSRYIMSGMYDCAAKHGPITGSGPGFDRAMRLFKARQDKVSRVGKWRKAPAKWKHNDGNHIDPEWYLVNWS